jgi:hypothetical protein
VATGVFCLGAFLTSKVAMPGMRDSSLVVESALDAIIATIQSVLDAVASVI